MEKKRELKLPSFNYYKEKPDHPNWNEIIKEAKEISEKILEKIEVRTSFLQNTLFQRRKLNALFRTIKNYRHNRKIIKKNNSNNFIPLFYIWTMTNQCNFACSYCSNHRGAKYPDLFKEGLNNNLSTEDAKKLIYTMKQASAIYFCGGEPTLRNDLPQLLEYSASLNMFNMINTNGSLIGDLLLKPGYERFLLNMDVVIISLDSLKIKTLADMYVVKERAASKVLRNILVLRMLNDYVPFKLSANTVITQETIEDTFDILDFCNDLGITFSPIAANIGHEPDWDLINNPRYKELVNKIIERGNMGYPMISSMRMLEKALLAKDIKCYPTIFDHVDYDGKIFWPCKAFSDAKMVNVLNFNTIMDAHEFAEKQLSSYNFHGDGENQCKGHCSWMQDVVTDTYGYALNKGLRKSKMIKEILGLL